MTDEARDEEWERWSDRSNAIEQRVDEAVRAAGRRCERLVLFSAYPTDAEDLPVDNLDEVAADGPVVFEHNDELKRGDGRPYLSTLVESPTWLQVCVLANDAIHTTGDTHHVFLEALVDTGRRLGNARVFRLSFGS